MIDKMIGGVQRALTGAITIVVLFGALVGLVKWADANPESWQALASKIMGTLVALLEWALDLIVSLLGG